MIEPQIVTKTVKTVVAGQVVSLGEVEVENPNLVLSTYEVEVIGVVEPTVEYEPPTVELSYLGEGTITVTNPNPTVLRATYDSVTRTIALVSNQSEEDDNVDVNLTVSLSRPGNCVTESVTLIVHCLPVGRDPQLTLINPNDQLSQYEGQYLQVSFLGDGEVSVESSNSKVIPHYDSSTKRITVSVGFSKYEAQNVTYTVTLAASPPYTAATTSLTVYTYYDNSPT